MCSRVKIQLAMLTLVILIPITAVVYRVNANRQQPPLIVLQSSERLFNDGINGIMAMPADNRLSYTLLTSSNNAAVFDQEQKYSHAAISSIGSAEAWAAGLHGEIYLADTSLNQIRTIDSGGKSLGTFSIPSPFSIAVLSDGNLVIASDNGENLLQVHRTDGIEISERFGQVKQFDFNNPEENRFLNRGKILVDSSDNIYYVTTFAPVPTVRKFSKKGVLLSEFAVDGAAIDIQAGITNRFLREKEVSKVGGYYIITSATIDPKTGNFWICTNGSSHTGLAYEYSSNGAKINEYAFRVSSPSGFMRAITGVKDIILRDPYIYLLTSFGDLYRFNLNDSIDLETALQTDYNGKWRRVIKLANEEEQEKCGVAQEPKCTVNCESGTNPQTIDCGADVQSRVGPGEIIENFSCNKNGAARPPTCSATATFCKIEDKKRVTSSYTSPTRTCNSPSSGGDDGGGGGPGDDQCCPNSEIVECCLRCECTPILIDVLGNGFSLTDGMGGVRFDLGCDGIAGRLAWTSKDSDDAWLVLDRSGDGKINNGSELFGNHSPQPESPTGTSKNGFLALAVYDKPNNGGNNDGQIDRRDRIFGLLRLWQDKNHNGISEPHELHLLTELGVAILELNYKESKRTDQHGNRFKYRAKVMDIQGANVGQWAWDVYLVR